MTNTALARRLLKLETNLPQGELEALSDDELNVLLLDVYRALSDDSNADEREERQSRMAEIEADIVYTAQKQASPDYARHLRTDHPSHDHRRQG